MDLYNIHTHKIDVEHSDCYKVRSVLNAFPQDFADEKSKYPNSWFSCGVHPWYSQHADDEIQLLREIVQDPKVVALGEIGLDKLRGPDMQTQLAVFRQQVDLAIKAQKPIIIHCVKAWDELISLYKEYTRTKTTWIIHGYRGNPEQTIQLSRLGLKFSIGEKFNKESLKAIPFDSIFCETDTSDLSICQIYQNISHGVGLNINQFAIFVEENVKKVFA